MSLTGLMCHLNLSKRIIKRWIKKGGGGHANANVIYLAHFPCIRSTALYNNSNKLYIKCALQQLRKEFGSQHVKIPWQPLPFQLTQH